MGVLWVKRYVRVCVGMDSYECMWVFIAVWTLDLT